MFGVEAGRVILAVRTALAEVGSAVGRLDEGEREGLRRPGRHISCKPARPRPTTLGVTPPRSIVPGRLCFVTARAVCRIFRFVPVPEVVRVFEYLFAVAAERFGMRVHEVLCMSNHFHVLMTDVEGRLPDFMEYFDSLLARLLNAMRGTSGAVFEKEYGLVEVTDDEKGLEHAVYTLANPCSAHLVRRSKQWPGFSTLRMDYGESRVIERPKVGLWKRDEAVENRRRRKKRDPRRARHRGSPACCRRGSGCGWCGRRFMRS